MRVGKGSTASVIDGIVVAYIGMAYVVMGIVARVGSADRGVTGWPI